MGSLYCPDCGNGFATTPERRAAGSTCLGFMYGDDCPECDTGVLAFTKEALRNQADAGGS